MKQKRSNSYQALQGDSTMKNRMAHRVGLWIIACFIVCFSPLFGSAMTEFGEGGNPVGGEMWPLGADKVANCPGRMGLGTWDDAGDAF
jgi:hypothetical protein